MLAAPATAAAQRRLSAALDYYQRRQSINAGMMAGMQAAPQPGLLPQMANPMLNAMQPMQSMVSYSRYTLYKLTYSF